jgi:poly(hydroxyalkanoate) depolymerase family esterase
MVLYPEQSTAANPRTCWNWFDTAHQQREVGEPALIVALLDDVLAQYPADPARTHLAGVSAGAAMAGLVAVAYPERFATLSSASGIAWGAAQDVGRALAVMAGGAGDGVPGADQVLAAMGERARAIPTLVIHGGADAVVSSRNGEETAAQWVGVFNRLRTRSGGAALHVAPVETSTVNDYTVHHAAWVDDDGHPLVESLRVQELGHAWSGGSTTGSFADVRGPDASRLIAAFCQCHPLPPR